jgi:5-methylcytosine-specific restriction endonuclease McrA
MGYTGDAKRAYQRAWMARRRDGWIRENGPCAWCGSEEQLEVDHIDPGTKLIQPRDIWSRRADVRAGELAKCQVLCRQCHIEKSAAEKAYVSPHGLRARYARKDENKCRCEECRQANAEYENARRNGV